MLRYFFLNNEKSKLDIWSDWVKRPFIFKCFVHNRVYCCLAKCWKMLCVYNWYGAVHNCFFAFFDWSIIQQVIQRYKNNSRSISSKNYLYLFQFRVAELLTLNNANIFQSQWTKSTKKTLASLPLMCEILFNSRVHLMRRIAINSLSKQNIRY